MTFDTFTTIVLFLSTIAMCGAFACWNTTGLANRLIRTGYLVMAIATAVAACFRAFALS